jgi:hypothetical protein
MRVLTEKDGQHRSINAVAEDWNKQEKTDPEEIHRNSQPPKEFPFGIPVAACTGSRFTRSAIRSRRRRT